MKSAKASALFALTAALVALPAYAQSGSEGRHGPRPSPLAGVEFSQIDTDGDGSFTVDDWRSFLTARFEQATTERLTARADALIAAGDTDGDGAVTRDELIAAFRAQGEERRAAREARRTEGAEAQGERGPRAERHGHRPHGHHVRGHGPRFDGHRFGGPRGERRDPIIASFQRLDRDADGRVTAEDFARMQERAAERAARHEERAAERQERRERRAQD